MSVRRFFINLPKYCICCNANNYTNIVMPILTPILQCEYLQILQCQSLHKYCNANTYTNIAMPILTPILQCQYFTNIAMPIVNILRIFIIYKNNFL